MTFITRTLLSASTSSPQSWTLKPQSVHSLLPPLLCPIPHKPILGPCYDSQSFYPLSLQPMSILLASLPLLFFWFIFLIPLSQSPTFDFHTSALSNQSFLFHCSRLLSTAGENPIIMLMTSHLTAAQQILTDPNVSLLPHSCDCNLFTALLDTPDLF